MVLGGEVAQRQVELGCEHEHREPGLEAEPASDQADSDGHRDERDPERRCELQHRPGEKRDAERAHRRAAVLVADLRDPLRLHPGAVEGAERRQPANDVGEVGGELRECPPARACAPLGVAADEPHEDGDEREREEHDAGRDEVDRGDEDEDCDRHDRRRARAAAGSGRRWSRARRSPPTATVATSALPASSRAAGRSRSRRSTSSRRSCESTVVAARLPATSKPHAVAARAAAATIRRTSGRVRLASEAPPNARAATWASRAACTSTSNAETTPSAASAPSRTRTARARGSRRGSRPPTAYPPVFRATSSIGLPDSSPPSRARKT